MANGNDIIFKRKIYDSLLTFKSWNGKRALLIEGARRVGKSTIVEEFAKKEYKSYILINFQADGDKATQPFVEFPNLEAFFGLLEYRYGVKLHERGSLIIFDEVQKFPRARECLKQLVADGRYDYIETGSLISINKNVKDIQLPSEERHISMHPMDFEEFLWALGKNLEYAKARYGEKKGVGDAMHRAIMKDYRLYLAIGGMPQAVDSYLKTHNFAEVDDVKEDIINLYRGDLRKLDNEEGYRASAVFDRILPNLLSHGETFKTSDIYSKPNLVGARNTFSAIEDSKIATFCRLVSEISPAWGMNAKSDEFKIYLLDTGLLVTMAFRSGAHPLGDDIYQAIIYDKTSANMGFILENAVAQALLSSGHNLCYYAYSDKDAHRRYEIDFILPHGKKTSLLEVKSASVKEHASLDKIRQKYSQHVNESIICCAKDYSREGDITYLPYYLSGLL